MPTAKINGIELKWELKGDTGDPLVLVHGSWSDHHDWDAMVPALSDSFRVVTYDRRGHSQSERPPGQGSVVEDVADLAALVKHLDMAPAHILGNSFGGSIVLRLAAEQPDLLRSVIVHEPPLFGVLEGPAAREVLPPLQEQIQVTIELLEAGQMERGARQFMELVFGPGAWEQMPEEERRGMVANAETFLDEQRDPEWLAIDRRRLAGFSGPVLLTQGNQSEPPFALVTDEIAQTLPQAQRRTIAGASHLPHITHPETYVEVVRSFLAGL